jgi:hypothetical protein
VAKPVEPELRRLRDALHASARSWKQTERRCRREARACMEALDFLRAFFARYDIDVQVTENKGGS